MDIEIAKKEFKIIIDTVRKIFKQDVKENDEDIYEIDGRQFLAIETVLNELEKKDKESQKETMQIYSDYQDIGKIAFDLDKKVQKLIEKLEKDINELETLNDNYIDADIVEGIYTTRGQIIKAKEILSILKGEKE